MTSNRKTISTRMYADIRVVGEGLAVCLGFDDGPDGERVPGIGMRRWSKGGELRFETPIGELLFNIMRVADVTAFDKLCRRPVQVVVEDGMPVELISDKDDRIRWRLL
jgi:hypothetical protein